MVRPRKLLITKEELEQFLRIGLSYQEIAYEIYKKYKVKVNRSTVFRRAKEYGIDHLNLDKKYTEDSSKRRKPIKLINPLMSQRANAYMDITEISYRRQHGKQRRSIKRYFLTLRANGKSYWVYIGKSQKEQNIIQGLIHLEQYLPKPVAIILIDKQLNPKLEKTHLKTNERIIYFTNTPKWHASKNLVEREHGALKRTIYPKFWRFKSSSYKQLTKSDEILLLRLYIEAIRRKERMILVNEEEMIKEILNEAKIIQ